MLGRAVDLDGYGARLMGELSPTSRCSPTTARLRDERGIRLAILHQQRARVARRAGAEVPVDELFELIVDSGFEGTRKPEPEIYALDARRGSGCPAEAALRRRPRGQRHAAREAGMHAIHFRETAQVIAELDALLV